MTARTIAIANPHAGRGRVAADRHAIEARARDTLDVDEFRYTTRAGEATEFAADAVRDGVDHVVAIGGDGLVNEVVNGLLAQETSMRPRLTPLPVGSGNDFVKSLGFPGVWPEPWPDLAPSRCDVGRVELLDGDGRSVVRHFVNVSSAGASAVIADHANRVPGFVPAKLRYRIATVMGLSRFSNPRLRMSVDDDEPVEQTVSMVAVANGTTFGAGMKVAPGARLDDGCCRIVVVGDVGLRAFALHGSALDRGDHVGLPFVRSSVARRVCLDPLGRDDVWVETDGERAGRLPARYTILPGALDVSRAVGPQRTGESASC